MNQEDIVNSIMDNIQRNADKDVWRLDILVQVLDEIEVLSGSSVTHLVVRAVETCLPQFWQETGQSVLDGYDYDQIGEV